MGKKKISILKLEPAAYRKTTFNKRSLGIKKKAKELCVLSDAKVMLLMQTPKAGYDLCLGENCTFDDIVQQYLSESQEKQDKSWHRSMEVLKNAYKGDEESYKVLMDGIQGTQRSPGEQQGSQKKELASIKAEISKLESQLGPLRNISEIDKIESFDELKGAKNLILELIANNEREKELFIGQQWSGGHHNFTIPYIRDLRCSTSTAAPDPTDHYMCAMDQQLDLGYYTSTAVPAPSNPYVPAPTDPYMHAMNQQ